MTYQPWQQRVVDERRDLDGKLDRLMAVLKTPPPGLLSYELGLLRKQSHAMAIYRDILTERISYWHEPTPTP